MSTLILKCRVFQAPYLTPLARNEVAVKDSAIRADPAAMVATLALAVAAAAYRGPLPARLAAHPRARASSPLLVETETEKGA